MKHKYAILTLLGLAVAVAGLALLRLAPASIETPLPYVMLGIGTGVFGWGAGELLKRRAVEGDPAVEKRLRIEQQDERNRTIADRAKARAYDASLYIFSALMLCFYPDAGRSCCDPAAGGGVPARRRYQHLLPRQIQP